MKRLAALLALAVLGGGPASAQETEGPVTWTSPLGDIVYSDEDGPFGVLTYETPFGDSIGRIYADGLAGEFGGTGPLEGYWSESDVSHDDENDTTLICPFPIIDGHGRTTRNWGRILIAFDSDWFPAGFILLRGRCFEEPREVIPGQLIDE